jgi:hypothetical protein
MRTIFALFSLLLLILVILLGLSVASGLLLAWLLAIDRGQAVLIGTLGVAFSALILWGLFQAIAEREEGLTEEEMQELIAATSEIKKPRTRRKSRS